MSRAAFASSSDWRSTSALRISSRNNEERLFFSSAAMRVNSLSCAGSSSTWVRDKSGFFIHHYYTSFIYISYILYFIHIYSKRFSNPFCFLWQLIHSDISLRHDLYCHHPWRRTRRHDRCPLCSARRVKVQLLDRNERVGRKLLVTGAGRANLTNQLMDASHYPSVEAAWMQAVLDKFGHADLIAFFKTIGILTFATSDGWCYPLSESAQSVVDSFENALHLAGVNYCLISTLRLYARSKRDSCSPVPTRSTFPLNIWSSRPAAKPPLPSAPPGTFSPRCTAWVTASCRCAPRWRPSPPR